MRKILTKDIWIGVGISFGLILIGLMIETSLLYRNLVGPKGLKIHMIALCVIASFFGSMIAARGKKQRLLYGMYSGGIVYILLWALTLAAEGKANFDGYAIQMTAAICGGSVFGGCLAPMKNRQKNGRRKGRQRKQTRRRAVT